jgi:hypothetical protein
VLSTAERLHEARRGIAADRQQTVRHADMRIRAGTIETLPDGSGDRLSPIFARELGELSASA